jgi:hypothetical protein
MYRKPMDQMRNRLKLPCVVATELVEKKIHFRLSILESIRLKLHIRFCKDCAIYTNHSHLIEQGIASYFAKNKDVQECNVENLKKSILNRIDLF